MLQEHYSRVEDLFHAALEEGPEFLEAACAGDVALKSEVAELLASYRDWSAGLVAPPDVGLPRFGPYECDGILGAGGMGTVYRAHRADGQFSQEVAVKVLRGSLRSDWYRQRFLAERQILAQLNHPNIARLLDGGMTEDGEPYLAMELVEGEPIDAYCDRQLLSIADRISLFDQVLDAVDYAHRHLIVHRDLKPSNIFVAPAGQVKLLDFGTSKLLEEDSTATAHRALTPRYASPEQLRGETVAIASDVFSAGVVLYELLAGAGPFGAGESVMASLERAVGRMDPLAPEAAVTDDAARIRSTNAKALRNALSGDLSSILLKSLSNAPASRYPTAAGLREDLERYQAGRPVVAKLPTMWYRARKFTRRHRIAVVTAALGVVLFTGAGIFSWYQARAARLEARRAKVVSDFLEKMLASTDPYAGGRADMKVVEVLDQASALAAQNSGGDPEIEAQIRLTLGTSYSSLDQVPKSIAEFRRGIALAQAAGNLRLLAWHRLGLGNNAGSVNQAESEPALRQAAKDAARLKGADPGLDFSIDLGLGTYLALSKPPGQEAEQLLLRAIQKGRTVSNLSGKDLGAAMAYLGKLYVVWGRPTQAEPWLAESLQRFRAMRKMPLEAWPALDGMARLAALKGDHHGAAAFRKEALDLDVRELGPVHVSTIKARSLWARSEAALGHLDVAEKAMEECIVELRKTYPRAAFVNWNIISAYAMVLNSAKKYSQAEVYAREALDSLTPDVMGTAYEAQSLYELGLSVYKQGRTRDGIAMLEKSVAIYRKVWGDENSVTKKAVSTLDKAHRGV
jgi:tetratricopeptide (TPR) repeat protein